MKNLEAVLISNNATNEIYLPNQTSITVDKENLKEFLNDPGDFRDWTGENHFEGSLEMIFEENENDIVSYYQNGELIIENQGKLADLKDILDYSEIKLETLQPVYNQWRKEIEDNNQLETEQYEDRASYTSYDCGEASVREAFTDEADLEMQITFNEMQKLEENYDPEFQLEDEDELEM